MQEIIIIAAVAENGVIGKDNKMPWDIKGNLAHFKEMTMGYPCIMGRKTWESLPKKPLPGRLNIVISKTMTEDNAPGRLSVKVCKSLTDAVELCAGHEKIFICGGVSVYREAMAIAHRIELTVIHKQYEGDVFFPEINPSAWNKTGSIDFDGFSFISYNKKP